MCSTEILIAVIDDDEPCRIAIQEALSVLGYCARGFASGDEFLATGDEGSYDCVITDIHMPGISGIDLKKLLVARGFAVPVITITARTDTGVVFEARDMLMDRLVAIKLAWRDPGTPSLILEARRCAAVRTGLAWFTSPRRSSCARTGSTARCCA